MLTATTSSCLCSVFCVALLPRWLTSGQQVLVSAVFGSVSIAPTPLKSLSRTSDQQEATWDAFKCFPSLPNFISTALNNVKRETKTVYLQHWEFPHWNLNIKIWSPDKLRDRPAKPMWALVTLRQDHSQNKKLQSISRWKDLWNGWQWLTKDQIGNRALARCLVHFHLSTGYIRATLVTKFSVRLK